MPSAAGSTAKPASSRARTISSHACSAAAGSASTSASRGHVASASPSRIPGRTPAASAAAVTAPTSGSPPGSGASAAGRSASDGAFRTAAFSSNPGMERQAIMGTYVLPEHMFPCKPSGNYPLTGGTMLRHGKQAQLDEVFEPQQDGRFYMVDGCINEQPNLKTVGGPIVLGDEVALSQRGNNRHLDLRCHVHVWIVQERPHSLGVPLVASELCVVVEPHRFWCERPPKDGALVFGLG